MLLYEDVDSLDIRRIFVGYCVENTIHSQLKAYVK